MPSLHIGIPEIGSLLYFFVKCTNQDYMSRIPKTPDSGGLSYATGSPVEPRRWMYWQVRIPASVSLFQYDKFLTRI